MSPLRDALHLVTLPFLVMTAGCLGYSSFGDVSHIPLVDLPNNGLHQYHQDVRLCQNQVLKLYEGKTDPRNQDREFRECLINKGYVLLS